jgi:flagellin
MAQVINSNISSLNAQRNLNSSQASLATSLQRLSSGLRINSAKDDAAGLAISERFTTQIRGNDQAARNANDGISLAQSAEGDLVTIASNLQRMRELAVQAANATNSDSDRKAIDGEVQALSAEIDRVAQNSSFNGTKLLDGSFTAKNFQIGANNTSSDVIQISSISSARTSDLGSAGSTFSATNTGTATTAALAAGDLTLNGQQVGASKIGALPGQSAASAFSIAEAINAVSGESGVTATANPNTVTGSAATAFTAIAADTFSINGINIGAVAAGGTAAGQGANVAAAINLKSAQTGVTASADTTTGALTLTAADGRDINIGLNGSAADAATATANKTAFLSQTGLATGNVGTQASTVGTAAVAAQNTIAFSGTTSVGETIVLNGVTFTIADAAGPSTVVDATNVTLNIDITGGNNSASQSATALFTAIQLAQGGAQPTSSALSTVTAADNTTGTVTLTDVTAGVSTTTISETAANGAATNTVAGAAATAGTAAVDAANHGTISLSSTSADGIVLGGGGAANAGFTTGTTAATTTSSVNSIASVNVLTAANASRALDAIDGALQTINTSRASLGAYQNRFATVVDSLQTRTENLAASKSRITDADFAKETANLTRAQILQQAGTAMLSQANQLPQGVLSLLR